jgi:membrane associated rhomboid family serine protease
MRNFRETLNLLSAIGMTVRNGAIHVARQVAPWTPFVQQQVTQHVAAEVQHQAVLQVERHVSQILWDFSVTTFSSMVQNPLVWFLSIISGITGMFWDIIVNFYYLLVTAKKINDEVGLFNILYFFIALALVNMIMQTGILQFMYKCYFDNDESNETNKTEQPEPEKTTKKSARLMSPRRK